MPDRPASAGSRSRPLLNNSCIQKLAGVNASLPGLVPHTGPEVQPRDCQKCAGVNSSLSGLIPPTGHGRKARLDGQPRDCVLLQHTTKSFVVINSIGTLEFLRRPSNLNRLNARECRRSGPGEVQDSVSTFRIPPIILYNKFIASTSNSRSYPGARESIWVRRPARNSARREQGSPRR